MTTPANPNRRKTRLVSLNTQRAFALRLTGHALLVIWVVGLSFIGFQGLFGPFEDPVAWEQFLNVSLLAFLASAVCVVPVLIFDAITYSHRFAGPVARLQSLVRQAGRGQPVERMRLRKNDFWCDVATDFNELLDRLESPPQPEAHDHGQAAAPQALGGPVTFPAVESFVPNSPVQLP